MLFYMYGEDRKNDIIQVHEQEQSGHLWNHSNELKP